MKLNKTEKLKLMCITNFIIGYGMLDQLDDETQKDVLKKLEKLRIQGKCYYVV